MLPVVVIILEPKSLNNDTTLLLPYVVLSYVQDKLPAPSVDKI